MPQLVGLVLIGAGLWAGYKAVARLSARLTAGLRRAEEEQQRQPSSPAEKNLGALELDTQTGVYKPAARC